MKKHTLLLLLLTSVHLTSCSTVEVQPNNGEIGDDCRSADSLYAISKNELYSSLSLQSLTLDLQSQPTANKAFGDLWDRVRKGYGLKVQDNYRIEEAVERFTRSPTYFEVISSRATPYLYHIVEEIERRKLPLELALLPAIESAYKPMARSHKSAVGLWQFIPSTGRTYGLEQNAWYDGRRDIIASTSAALDYLEKLYYDFGGDWLKAIGAYNCGEGCMQRAVNKNEDRGEPTDFWSLDLPKETQDYVPSLLAVAKVIGNPQSYGVQLANIPNKTYLKQIDVGRQIDLSLAADLAGISEEEFKLLNAGHRRQITAPQGPHCVTLPVEKVAEFKQRLADISGLDDVSSVESLPPRTSLASLAIDKPREILKPAEKIAVTSTETEVTKPVTIAQAVIAEPAKTSLAVEKPREVKPAERMAVTSTDTETEVTESSAMPEMLTEVVAMVEPTVEQSPLPVVAHQTAKKTRAKVEKEVKKKAVKVEKKVQTASRKVEKPAKKQQLAEKSEKTQTHQVKPGETLVRLAHRYNTTVVKLRKLNKLESHSLQKGQKLQVPVSSLLPSITRKVAAAASAKVESASHQVQAGETLWRIAKRYAISVVELRKLNKLAQPIRPGQELIVPAKKDATLSKSAS